MKTSLFLILSLSVLSSFAFAEWQSSVTPKVELGVRDKYAEPGQRFQAVFIVTGPDGVDYSKTIDVLGNEFAIVNFPAYDFTDAQGEFLAYARPGVTYKWQVKVGHRRVAGGRFYLGNGTVGR